MVLLVMLTSVGNVDFCLLSTQEDAQVTFLHPEHQLNGENPLGGTQQPELAEESGCQYNQLWTAETWPPAAVISVWNQRMGFPTSGSRRDPMLYCACTRPLEMIICAMMCSFH